MCYTACTPYMLYPRVHCMHTDDDGGGGGGGDGPTSTTPYHVSAQSSCCLLFLLRFFFSVLFTRLRDLLAFFGLCFGPMYRKMNVRRRDKRTLFSCIFYKLCCISIRVILVCVGVLYLYSLSHHRGTRIGRCVYMH